jgi:hypothetical protein
VPVHAPSNARDNAGRSELAIFIMTESSALPRSVAGTGSQLLGSLGGDEAGADKPPTSLTGAARTKTPRRVAVKEVRGFQGNYLAQDFALRAAVGFAVKICCISLITRQLLNGV